jgi:ATP-dependent Lhr-like helicase
MIRFKLDEYVRDKNNDIEVAVLEPLFTTQQKYSIIPQEHEFLIETFRDREGHHVLMYPFEGRFVHEGMGALLSYRIGQIKPLTFSIAMNDYGFELLSDQEIPIEAALDQELFHTNRLRQDIYASINAAEMARKRFRDIASIAGLVFKGYPGKYKKERHLQSSTSLLFEVFKDYDPNNLLYMQAYDEALVFQLEEVRLRNALNRIAGLNIKLIKTSMPTPFSFPIIVDRLRERMSTEKLIVRIERMKLLIDK